LWGFILFDDQYLNPAQDGEWNLQSRSVWDGMTSQQFPGFTFQRLMQVASVVASPFTSRPVVLRQLNLF
jgi:hypothetical protein